MPCADRRRTRVLRVYSTLSVEKAVCNLDRFAPDILIHLRDYYILRVKAAAQSEVYNDGRLYPPPLDI
jgi:hypothetical protein